jgi:hypothetical protein
VTLLPPLLPRYSYPRHRYYLSLLLPVTLLLLPSPPNESAACGNLHHRKLAQATKPVWCVPQPSMSGFCSWPRNTQVATKQRQSTNAVQPGTAFAFFPPNHPQTCACRKPYSTALVNARTQRTNTHTNCARTHPHARTHTHAPTRTHYHGPYYHLFHCHHKTVATFISCHRCDFTAALGGRPRMEASHVVS